MRSPAPGCVAVVFVSGRNHEDPEGYAAAAQAMEARAAAVPGYLGIDAVRGADGIGITISWWRTREAALRWRDDPEHRRIRALGRGRWYDWYRVTVAEVERGYGWAR